MYFNLNKNDFSLLEAAIIFDMSAQKYILDKQKGG